MAFLIIYIFLAFIIFMTQGLTQPDGHLYDYKIALKWALFWPILLVIELFKKPYKPNE